MITKNINFKNFQIKKNFLKVKKDLKLLLKENNTVLKSLSTSYKNNYKVKMIQKFKNYNNFNNKN